MGYLFGVISVDPRNPRALALCEALRQRVDFASLPEDLAVVFGGDGWMLQSIRTHGPARTYFGINAGHLGFLLNNGADLSALCETLCSARYRSFSFPQLHLRAWDHEGRAFEAEAVNDIYLERSTGQTAHLTVRVDGQPAVEQLVCDGLIVATALGSTAYSYSAGGVPCHPRVQAMHVTPIAPHAPRLSPVVLPLDSVVEVEAHATRKRPVRVVCDGVEQGSVQRLRVERGRHDVRLAFAEDHAFTATLIQKVLKA